MRWVGVFVTRERLEMGVARSVCVRSRMVRSPKYSAAALWLLVRCLLAAKGAAWLRPLFSQQNTKGF